MKKRDRIKAKYGYMCSYCGDPLQEKWQVDHKVSKQYWQYLYPENPQGLNKDENLVPACNECNHYKRSHCVESSGYHVGYREYMMKFHIRLGKLPKTTQVERTKRRIEYMWTIARKYGIEPQKPWSGVFHMDKYNKPANDHIPEAQRIAGEAQGCKVSRETMKKLYQMFPDRDDKYSNKKLYTSRQMNQAIRSAIAQNYRKL